jgi:hypothetical protein
VLEPLKGGKVGKRERLRESINGEKIVHSVLNNKKKFSISTILILVALIMLVTVPQTFAYTPQDAGALNGSWVSYDFNDSQGRYQQKINFFEMMLYGRKYFVWEEREENTTGFYLSEKNWSQLMEDFLEFPHSYRGYVAYKYYNLSPKYNYLEGKVGRCIKTDNGLGGKLIPPSRMMFIFWDIETSIDRKNYTTFVGEENHTIADGKTVKINKHVNFIDLPVSPEKLQNASVEILLSTEVPLELVKRIIRYNNTTSILALNDFGFNTTPDVTPEELEDACREADAVAMGSAFLLVSLLVIFLVVIIIMIKRRRAA